MTTDSETCPKCGSETANYGDGPYCASCGMSVAGTLRAQLATATARIIEVSKECGKLKAEVERLRAVVDKLPKTADGVALHEGLNLWWFDGDDLKVTSAVAIRAMVPVLGGNDWGVSALEKAYSTREAAEAAKESDDE